ESNVGRGRRFCFVLRVRQQLLHCRHAAPLASRLDVRREGNTAAGQVRFQEDVNRSARYYARSRYPQYPLEIREQLSRAYLLEEIALNVRLHIDDGIDDEYYMGEQLGILVNLYHSKYGFNAFDLANVSGDGRKIRFFGFGGNDCASWSEHLPEA
ncbi:MAG TPA: hypothetical protein VKE42_07240, partial [Candidatus Cybelea sp.]|nr:hypothetical protein [Candidatus Cybelea sp.]